jgi:antitoxin component YwqK of YwqJK toxin-antitoxin module
MGADNTIVSSIKSLNSKRSYAKINLVKSKFILKQVFDHINIRKKLNIIIHNKELRSILEYNINDYKKLSAKEIIIEKNGKGKEYIIDKNILIFEGEYSKGKRNGKGNEYYINGQLKSEGTYLKGEKNGKFKEYYFNGQLKFDGEYLNGNKIKGIGFDNIYGNLILSIENRKIKEYYRNREIKFEGEYLNGKRWNGKIYNYNNDEIYELKYGNGEVKEYNEYEDILFEGKYINGQKNGEGKLYHHSKLIFQGEYLNDKKNGKGKEYNNNGKLIFDGIYYNDNKWKGKCICYYENDDKNDKDLEDIDYDIDDINDDVNKKESKKYYEIEYLDGKKWNGKIYNFQGDKEFEIKNGNGYIKEYYYESSDIKYEGLYINGEKNGYGKEFKHDNEYNLNLVDRKSTR